MTAIDEPPYHPGYDEPDEPPRPRPATPRPARGTPAHDPDAERAALGSMLTALDACDTIIETGITTADFHNPFHADVYQAICDQIAAGQQPDVITTSGQLLDRWPRARIDVFELQAATDFMWTAAGRYATRIATCGQSRRLQAAALAVAEAAANNDLALAAQRINAINDAIPPTLDERIHHQDLVTFLTNDEPAYDWIVPGLLERTDRVLLTGPEGGGKSTLLRQIAVQLAAGIHPFTHTDITPLRVLLLDLENSERHIRRALRALHPAAGHAADHNLLIASYPQGLDLTDPDDNRSLTTLVATTTPDVIIGGPIYKLVGGDPTEEQPAKAAAMTLDRLRVTHNCAFLLETHQPHGTGSDRPERPYGASLWKRWPEFGLHISEVGNLRHWRGARDERDWPSTLQRGGAWPWTISTVAELIPARSIDLYERLSRCVEDLNQKDIQPLSNAICASVPGAKKAKVDGLAWLTEHGYLTFAIGANSSKSYRSITPYRADDQTTSEDL